MTVEQQIERAIQSFVNSEGIDARLNEPDFSIAARCMNYKPIEDETETQVKNEKSIRQLLQEIE